MIRTRYFWALVGDFIWVISPKLLLHFVWEKYKIRRFDKKKVAHFGEIVIKMYRTEMMNAEYFDLRQMIQIFIKRGKKLHKKWQYHDLRNSKYDPLAAVVTLTWPIFTSLYKQLFVA